MFKLANVFPSLKPARRTYVTVRSYYGGHKVCDGLRIKQDKKFKKPREQEALVEEAGH